MHALGSTRSVNGVRARLTAFAVGDRRCFTLTAASGSSTYCAVLEDIRFDGSQATVAIRLEDRVDTNLGAPTNPRVNVQVGGNTIHDQQHPFDGQLLEVSGNADGGDGVTVTIVTGDFNGGQLNLFGTVPGAATADLSGAFRDTNLPPTEILPPQAFDFDVRVRNDGNADASVTLVAELQGPDTDFLASQGLSIGANSVNVATIDVPADAIEVAPGSYDLVLRTADDLELDRRSFTVLGPETPSILGCSLPTSAAIDDEIPLSVDVSNPNPIDLEVDVEYRLADGTVFKREPNVGLPANTQGAIESSVIPQNVPAVRESIPAGSSRTFAISVHVDAGAVGSTSRSCGSITVSRPSTADGTQPAPSPIGGDLSQDQLLLGGGAAFALLLILATR